MVAIFYHDGFDLYAAATALVANAGSGWAASGNGNRPRVDYTAPRNGVACMFIDGTDALGANPGDNAQYVFGAPISSPTFQFALRLINLNTQQNGAGLTFYNATNDAIAICLNMLGQLVIQKNGVIKFTYNAIVSGVPTVFLPGVYRSVAVTINTSGIVDLFIDNQAITSAPTGAVFSDVVYMAAGIVNNGVPSLSAGGGRILIDDLVGYQGIYAGDMAVLSMLPTANAAPQDWTPSSGNAWDRINNVPYVPSEFIQATAAGNISLFEHGNPVANIVSIYSVAVQYIAQRTGAGLETMRSKLKQAASTTNGNTVTPPQSSFNQFSDLYTSNPNTGLGWTVADLAAGVIQLGFERVT